MSPKRALTALIIAPSVRAAMQRLFVGFYLGTSDLAAALVDEPAPETENLLDPVEIGSGLLVWAELSPAAVLGIDNDQAPILERQPVHRQNGSNELPIQYLFRPIPCPTRESRGRCRVY